MAEDRAPGPAGKPRVVQSVLLERGWEKFEQGGQDGEDWNLYWRASTFHMAEHANITPWQRLNHHPGTTRLTRKDHLARHLRHMRKTYGAALDKITPLTFLMPNDCSKFVAEYFREKPGAAAELLDLQAGGALPREGILLFRDIKDLVFEDTYVVQKYICHPLLVGRYKCDLRVSACVTGFQPLTIYLYQEGSARFATEKFDLGSLRNSHAHLTNSSIGKCGASSVKVKEVVGHGCKWT